MVFTTAAARATRASKKTGEGLAEFYSQFYLASTFINILCVLCFCFAHSVLENISQYLCWWASFHQRIMSEAAASSVRKKPASQLAKEAITLRTHYHLPGLERKVSTTRKLLPAKRCVEQNTPVEPAPEPKAKPQPKKHCHVKRRWCQCPEGVSLKGQRVLVALGRVLVALGASSY